MKGKILFFIGLICMLAGIADLVLWIVISGSEEKSFQTAVNEYIGLFPDFLANPIKLTLLNILLLLMAMGCLSNGPILHLLLRQRRKGAVL